jgi:hypothetical protein
VKGLPQRFEIPFGVPIDHGSIELSAVTLSSPVSKSSLCRTRRYAVPSPWDSDQS